MTLQEGQGQQCFQKKRPIMSQEFINQHTVEHNGRNICKYFIEGRCIKVSLCILHICNVQGTLSDVGFTCNGLFLAFYREINVSLNMTM